MYDKGDQVFIRKDLYDSHNLSERTQPNQGNKCSSPSCPLATIKMCGFAGFTATVRHRHISPSGKIGYTLDIDNEDHYWGECMFLQIKNGVPVD